MADLDAWAWVATGVAVVAVAVAFVARAGAAGCPRRMRPDRLPTRPHSDGVLHGPDGPVAVHDLTDVAARLLVFGDPTVDPGLLERVSSGAARLAPVRAHVVVEATDRWDGDLVLLDPGGTFRHRLGAASPGAVLLGTDRMLAGGPVAGDDDVADLVEAVAAELGVTRPS